MKRAACTKVRSPNNLGYFQNGFLNGKGEKRMATSSYYIGEFRDSLKQGTGREETIDHIYEGEYHADKKEGKGKLVYKTTNDYFEGEFRDNFINGYGYYTWANKDTYEGFFINGKMHGKGKYKWPDGGEYYGDYINNIKEGLGRFRWANGRIFDGPFKDGKPNGIGKLTVSGKTIEVEFVDGKVNKSYKPKRKTTTKDLDSSTYIANNSENQMMNNSSEMGTPIHSSKLSPIKKSK